MLGQWSLFFWDTLVRLTVGGSRRSWPIICINAAFFALTISLISDAGSATSTVCLVLGCLVITAAHSKTIRRRPKLLTVMIPAGIALYLLLEFGFDIDIVATLSEAVGRNPDLTGRTTIWSAVLGADTNRLVGTGYDTFWLGPRLRTIWELAGTINESHNGYLETYVNLGLFGLLFLAGFLVASYRSISRRFRASPSSASLSLALWTVLLFYNVTESAFSSQLLWIVYLLCAIVVQTRSEPVSISTTARPRLG